MLWLGVSIALVVVIHLAVMFALYGGNPDFLSIDTCLVVPGPCRQLHESPVQARPDGLRTRLRSIPTCHRLRADLG